MSKPGFLLLIWMTCFFRMIVEALNHEIFICDANGENSLFESGFGIFDWTQKENIVGKNIRELSPMGTISHQCYDPSGGDTPYLHIDSESF